MRIDVKFPNKNKAIISMENRDKPIIVTSIDPEKVRKVAFSIMDQIIKKGGN